VTQQAILAKFDTLNVWKRGGQRAPHKPLLVLFALARWQQGEAEISFEETAPILTDLLKEFGPDRKQYHPELPFHHLQRDGIWKMDTAGKPIPRTGSNNFTRRELLNHQATGCFTEDVLAALNRDPTLAAEIATTILDAHFPDSLHSEILVAVGLDLDKRIIFRRRPRDPQFRDRILTAYEYRCAVCGFDVRLGGVRIVFSKRLGDRWKNILAVTTNETNLDARKILMIYEMRWTPSGCSAARPPA
jgi:putative restriction endonuclease